MMIMIIITIIITTIIMMVMMIMIIIIIKLTRLKELSYSSVRRGMAEAVNAADHLIGDFGVGLPCLLSNACHNCGSENCDD
jgi:hypothetical protein